MSEERLRRSPRVLHRSVGREVVLAAPGRDDFDSLSASGAAIWRLLEVPRTPAELVEAVAAEFGVPPDAIASEIRGFVEDLRRRGLVEPVPAGAG